MQKINKEKNTKDRKAKKDIEEFFLRIGREFEYY